LGLEAFSCTQRKDSSYVPDLVFIDKKKKAFIIEVGETTPEKIWAYQNDPNVREIRWYTRDLRLVGQWFPSLLEKTKETFTIGEKYFYKENAKELTAEQKKDIEKEVNQIFSKASTKVNNLTFDSL
jgi:hypothetical protein